MKMPFGKYRGCQLWELPNGYLRWLVSLLDLREPLRSAVYAELRARADHNRGRPPHARALPDPQVARDLIAAGRRVLAAKYHPDAGGGHEVMVAINLAADWLEAQVR